MGHAVGGYTEIMKRIVINIPGVDSIRIWVQDEDNGVVGLKWSNDHSFLHRGFDDEIIKELGFDPIIEVVDGEIVIDEEVN